MKSGIVRHGRLALCVLAVVSQIEISVCERVSFQHHGHYPLTVSYLSLLISFYYQPVKLKPRNRYCKHVEKIIKIIFHFF